MARVALFVVLLCSLATVGLAGNVDAAPTSPPGPVDRNAALDAEHLLDGADDGFDDSADDEWACSSPLPPTRSCDSDAVRTHGGSVARKCGLRRSRRATPDHGLTDGTGAVVGPGGFDFDEDCLVNARERAVGTHIGDADTDDDGLLDGWEVRGRTPSGAVLPGADSLHMDLYVQVDYAAGVRRLSDRQKRYVERTWATFEVANPDGTMGIDVHIDDASPRGGRLSTPHVVDSMAEYDRLRRRYGTRETMGSRFRTYHRVVVADVTAGAPFAGLGDAPGSFAVVDHDTRPAQLVVHELLHNVVGPLDPDHRCDDPYHTCSGWLARRFRPFATDGILEELRRDGIGQSL